MHIRGLITPFITNHEPPSRVLPEADYQAVSWERAGGRTTYAFNLVREYNLNHRSLCMADKSFLYSGGYWDQ